MENHVFWDEDIEKAVNCARIGSADIYELVLVDKEKESICLHKADVIALAKCFGLAVFEKDS